MPPKARGSRLAALRPTILGLVKAVLRVHRGEDALPVALEHARRALRGLGPEERARLLVLAVWTSGYVSERWQEADLSADVEQWLQGAAGDL